MEGFAYFPAVVYRDERPDLVEKALPTCVQYLDQVRKPEWPMCQSAHLGNNLELREVADYLLLSSVDLLRGQSYAVEKYDFYLSGLWAQEIKRGVALMYMFTRTARYVVGFSWRRQKTERTPFTTTLA